MRIGGGTWYRRLRNRPCRIFSVRTVMTISFCCALAELSRRFLSTDTRNQFDLFPVGNALPINDNPEFLVDSDAKKNDIRNELEHVHIKSADFEHRVADPQFSYGGIKKDEVEPRLDLDIDSEPTDNMEPVQLPEVNNNREKNRVEKQKIKMDEPFYKNRIIHFDLKGAAPKVPYLKKVMKLIKNNGATGILLEWEDTFPFTGILSENRNTEAYTMDDVTEILQTAADLGLDIIPLVQTFGHLEWILKIEKFRKHRENDLYPQVVCLADEEGIQLVKEAIKQVIDVHLEFGIPYFHIGADEAFEFGVCMKDQEWFSKNPDTTKHDLAALHLKQTAEYVLSLAPKARILAWYDMVKSFPPDLVHKNNLHNLLEVVVWDYSETIQQQNEMTWRSLSASFPKVWGSSAYKGANHASTQLLNLRHYVMNTMGWSTHRKLYGQYFQSFGGLILTGWQRYDHFAVLCELLPVGLPSAIINLLIANAGKHIDEVEISKKAAIALNCPSVTIDDPSIFGRCDFPGAELYGRIHMLLTSQLEQINEGMNGNERKGWLGRFNIRHNYTQHWYLRQIESELVQLYNQVKYLESNMRKAMEPIFQSNTIDEWIYEYLDPTLEKLTDLLNQLRQLNRHRVFPVRNFPIQRSVHVEL